MIFPFSGPVCPHWLPAHIKGSSLSALADLLVVIVKGAHISLLSGLGKAVGKSNPPHIPSNVCSQLVSLGRPRASREAVRLAEFVLLRATLLVPWGLRLGKHRALGMGMCPTHTVWGWSNWVEVHKSGARGCAKKRVKCSQPPIPWAKVGGESKGGMLRNRFREASFFILATGRVRKRRPNQGCL